MSALEHVRIAPLASQRFKEIFVNSTMRGGAEMLASLAAYARGAGVDSRWVVMRGNPDFFRLTKRIHNMLHGSPGDGAGLGADARGRLTRAPVQWQRESWPT